MVFALFLVPAIAGAFRGAVVASRKYRAGKDLVKNPQALVPPSLWTEKDWGALDERAKALLIKGITKHQEVEAAKAALGQKEST